MFTVQCTVVVYVCECVYVCVRVCVCMCVCACVRLHLVARRMAYSSVQNLYYGLSSFLGP